MVHEEHQKRRKLSLQWVALSGRRLQVNFLIFVLLTLHTAQHSHSSFKKRAGRTEGYHHTAYAREGKEMSKEDRAGALPCLTCSLLTTQPPCVCGFASSSALSFKRNEGVELLTSCH